MNVVNIHEAKTRLSQLVERALAGEDVVAGRHGEPLVRITRIVPDKVEIRFGLLEGRIRIADDFAAPLPADVLATTSS